MNISKHIDYSSNKIETREDFEHRITKFFNQFHNQDVDQYMMEHRFHHRFLIRDVEEAYENISKINKMTFMNNMMVKNDNIEQQQIYEQYLKQLKITEKVLYKFELEYKDLLEPNLLYFQ